jgi:hypothetical protein
MPRNSGTYTLPSGNPVSAGTVIEADWANNTLADIAAAISASLAKDGQTTPTANLPMGGFRHTGVGDASARSQYASAAQVQDGALNIAGSVAGTDTVTASLDPAIALYADGMEVVLVPANTVTGAATLSLNGLTARPVVKYSGVALVAGDMAAGIPAVLRYDLANTRWVLQNPIKVPDAALSSNVPKIDGVNVFTNANYIASNGPFFALIELDQAANSQRWAQYCSGNVYHFAVSNDSETVLADYMAVTRSGGTVTAVALTATSISFNGVNLTDLALSASVVPNARTITSGNGLTGGGDLSANRTLAVGAGTGITVNADDVALDTSSTHNTDHASVSITAGGGLTGGGDLSATRTLAVGAGDGITVNADDVAVNNTVLRTTGAQGVAGVKTFSDRPIFTSAGGFLSNAAAANAGGVITLSNSLAGSAAAVGSPGDMRFVYS